DSMHFENSPEDGEIGNDAEKTRLHNKLSQFAGILVPGGFGSRGSQGIINTCNYARVNNIPFLGICFGFQLAIVEFARNVCGLNSANSTEINPDTDNPVVIYMPEQKNIKEMGGTMRLGLHEINVKSGSIA